eukprot:g16710.t1
MDDFKVGSRCRAISNTSKKGHLHTTTQEQTTTINLKTFSSSLRHSSQQRRGPAPGGQLQIRPDPEGAVSGPHGILIPKAFGSFTPADPAAAGVPYASTAASAQQSTAASAATATDKLGGYTHAELHKNRFSEIGNVERADQQHRRSSTGYDGSAGDQQQDRKHSATKQQKRGGGARGAGGRGSKGTGGGKNRSKGKGGARSGGILFPGVSVDDNNVVTFHTEDGAELAPRYEPSNEKKNGKDRVQLKVQKFATTNSSAEVDVPIAGTSTTSTKNAGAAAGSRHGSKAKNRNRTEMHEQGQHVHQEGPAAPAADVDAGDSSNRNDGSTTEIPSSVPALAFSASAASSTGVLIVTVREVSNLRTEDQKYKLYVRCTDVGPNPVRTKSLGNKKWECMQGPDGLV